MKRPLVPLALSYAAGLLLAEALQPPLPALFALAFALLALVLVASRWRSRLLFPFLIVLGWTNLVSRTAVVSPDDLRRIIGEEPVYLTVRGTLNETPSLRIFERDEQESYRSLARISVTGLNRGTNWQPAYGAIMVTTKGELPEAFFSGQRVEITGILARPPKPIAAGLFDYHTYLARQGIHYQLKASSTNDWRVVEPALVTPPPSDRFLAWAKHTMARGLPNQDESLRLMWAMTLGWKTALTGEVNEPFMRSGTMHIFAISGLHIALIAGILVSLLRVLQVSRIWCGVVVIPLIWFYTAATGWQPSAVRSTVMMTIIIGGWALRRPSDLLNSLAAAAFVILLWDPQQLYQASFQLSFFVVLSIALFMPPLEKIRDRLFQIDPMLPPELLPRWQRLLRPPLRFVATSFATSLAAWLGSLPLTAYYFHLLSPVTLLANLVIVPLSSLALSCNLGSLICGGWLPWATELFNHGGWFWMSAMVKVSHWCTELPGAYFYVRAPSGFTFLAYYGLLVGVMSGWLLARQRRVWMMAALALISAVYGWRWQSSRAEFQLTVLPLNGGHSVFVNGPGRANDWLIDCGNTNSVEFVMKPFLRAQGVNRVPRLALTHGDLQHVGGVQPLEELFGVERIVTSSIRFRSATYRRIVGELERTPARWQVVNRGDAIGSWRALHPEATDKFTQADDAALVLRGEFHGARVLLLSDLGRPGQNALIEREPDLRADIVVTGLPEQTEALCDALLDAIRPKVIIVADSEFPATKRASPQFRERLERRGLPVFYTRNPGAVTITFRPGDWNLRNADGQILSSSARPKR